MIVHLTRAALMRMFPRPAAKLKALIWDAYLDALLSEAGQALLKKYDITPQRWLHLAATWAPETAGLTLLHESGAYTAAGILRVFGPQKHSAKVSASEAEKLAGDGPALFERVYGLGNPEKAKELGNTKPGDGWTFRGLGPNQLTGRWAHEKAAREIGVSVAELQTPIHAIHAALWEWWQKDCNAWADRDDCVSVRKLINGGSLNVSIKALNGLPEAKRALAKAKTIWGPDAPAEAEPPPVVTPAPVGPSRITVARKSPSVLSGLAAVAATLVQSVQSGLEGLQSVLLSAFGLLPDAMGFARLHTSTMQELGAMIAFNLTPILQTFTIGCILLFVVRHIDLKEKTS